MQIMTVYSHHKKYNNYQNVLFREHLKGTFHRANTYPEEPAAAQYPLECPGKRSQQDI